MSVPKDRGADANIEPFLRLLWGDEPLDNACVTTFALPGTEVGRHRSAVEAAEWCRARSAAGEDVYVGLAAMDVSVEKGRGKLDDVRAVAGFMVDLDLQNPSRRKKNLFDTLEEARDFLTLLPLGPTLVIASGGGLQAWWLFREPVDTPDAGARARLSGVSLGWGRYVIEEARKIDRVVDSTHDLTRIARVPGTMNRKYGEPREVRVESVEPLRRYSVDDFDAFAAPPVVVGVVTSVSVKLLPDASPPAEKLEVLQRADPKFRQTWDRARRDLKDQSQSGYDLALAALAVRAGWTDQEIANLLICHRRKHQQDLKLRENYYAGTIGKARDGLTVEELQSEIASAGVPNDEEGREKVLTLFSALTGARLDRVTRFLPDGAELAFYFIDGRTFTITHTELTDWLGTWRALSRAGFFPLPSRPNLMTWLGLINGLTSIAEPVVVESDGATPQIAAWCKRLAMHFVASEGKESDEAERAKAIVEHGAFVREGRLWVKLEGLAQYALDQRSRLTKAQIRHGLTERLHAERRTFVARASAALLRQDRTRQVGATFYGVHWNELHMAVDPDAPIAPVEEI